MGELVKPPFRVPKISFSTVEEGMDEVRVSVRVVVLD